MSINGRIREIRKSLKMNQKNFGAALGLGQGAVSWMEQEGNTVTAQNISTICAKFNINENWLLEGSGTMHLNDLDVELAALSKKYTLSPEEYEIMSIFLRLDPIARKAMIEHVLGVADAFRKSYAAAAENQQQAAPPAEEPPHAAEKRVSDAERAELHRSLDEEIDAEEKARSVSKDGSIAKRA